MARTRKLADLIAAKDYDTALTMRGDSYTEMVARLPLDLARPAGGAHQGQSPPGSRSLNVGGLAPGMNAAARAAVRLGLHRGHTMLGVYGSFRGLIDGDVRELQWGDVEGLDQPRRRRTRDQPARADGQGPLRDRPRTGEARASTALLIIGGWDAFEAAHTMNAERDRYPAFQIPMICLPATIDNNMPSLRAVGRAPTAR